MTPRLTPTRERIRFLARRTPDGPYAQEGLCILGSIADGIKQVPGHPHPVGDTRA